MTALVISNPKLSFLQKIVSINFPERVHEWTASAEVAVQISYSFDKTFSVVTLTSPLGTATITPAGLNDPKGIVGSFSFSGPGIPQNGSADMIISKEEIGVHPHVDVHAEFTVSIDGGDPSISASVRTSATGVTSGRPGGDAEATSSPPVVQLNFSDGLTVATCIGSATAGLSVTADATCTGS